MLCPWASSCKPPWRPLCGTEDPGCWLFPSRPQSCPSGRCQLGHWASNVVCGSPVLRTVPGTQCVSAAAAAAAKVSTSLSSHRDFFTLSLSFFFINDTGLWVSFRQICTHSVLWSLNLSVVPWPHHLPVSHWGGFRACNTFCSHSRHHSPPLYPLPPHFILYSLPVVY